VSKITGNGFKLVPVRIILELKAVVNCEFASILGGNGVLKFKL